MPFTVPTGSGLPAPWTTQDIGSPTVAGSASFVNGTFTVAGAGRDIWDNADQFRFVYQPLSGNGEIVARVGSLGNRDAWSKAAVMIRETLSGDSPHALVAVTPDNGTVFQWRAAPAGVSATLTGLATGAPQWVRVVRNGTALSGYYSANGATWTLISTTTVTMAAQVYVGLAVTSHNPAVTANATFNNVTVTSAPAAVAPLKTSSATSSPATVGSATATGDTLTASATATKLASRATPRLADYDGDGKADLVLFRPSTGAWQVVKSTTNTATTLTIEAGLSDGVPIAGDFDGDGKADVAFYQPITGMWTIFGSSATGTAPQQAFAGGGNAVPVPGDYDGDGKTDVAAYFPSTGHWQILKQATDS